MPEFFYKAYLSYSHADEVWARWLHRALETYRVPGSLRKTHGDGRRIPEQLSPIFRDRDDLSSNASLDDGLKEALRQSESLILICSPNAVTSRWVNEEVRYFLTLGRSHRVFCVLVDGAEEGHGLSECLPPALLEGSSKGAIEPLAVDPRPFADGKDLAKLKLVAGLLGFRLDELRRREHKRKRRRQMLVAASVIGAFVLAGFAISARQAEQRERQSAEQMASFIVDLGEQLKPEIGLEALGLISTRAMSYLEDLDPDQLTPDTGKKVGLALRQIGQVSDGQGRGDEAIDAFGRSRDLFLSLTKRYPDRQDLLFELGQSEFYIASYYFYSGQQASALKPAKRYAAVSQRLYDSDPENLQWKFERSYAVTGLLAMEVDGVGPFEAEILDQSVEALDLARELFDERPDDLEAILNYSSNLAWAADAHMLACDLDLALKKRQETLDVTELALRIAPAVNASRAEYAYARSGFASLKAQSGDLIAARDLWNKSIQTLKSLWREDPSNELFFKRPLQLNRLSLASVLVDHEFDAEALELLDAVESDVPELSLLEGEDLDLVLASEHFISMARVKKREGDAPSAQTMLQRVMRSFEDVDLATMSFENRMLLIEAQHLWWQVAGSLPEDAIELQPDSNPGLRSCDMALSNARIAMINGQPELALTELEYLKSKGYKGADAAAICRQLDGCTP